MALRLLVNGVERNLSTLEAGASVQEVVGAMGMKVDRVAVERNGEIVRRRDWGTTSVGEMDRLEVVHFVGGGLVRTSQFVI